jgi:hypothetical protein
MKKVFFLFLGLLLLAMSCATVSVSTEKPLETVYITGNNEPAASSASSLQPAGSSDAPECPVYYTGREEPAASSGVVEVEN